MTPRLIETQYVEELDYQDWDALNVLWDPQTGRFIDRRILTDDRPSVLWAFFAGAVAGALLTVALIGIYTVLA